MPVAVFPYMVKHVDTGKNQLKYGTRNFGISSNIKYENPFILPTNRTIGVSQQTT